MTNNIIDYEKQSIKKKQSGFGISSFIVALVQGLITAILIVFAGVLSASGPQEDHEIGFMIIGLGVFGGAFLHLVGVGLGVAGLFQKNRKKAFSILGLIFNCGALLTVGLLLLVGLAIG